MEIKEAQDQLDYINSKLDYIKSMSDTEIRDLIDAFLNFRNNTRLASQRAIAQKSIHLCVYELDRRQAK